MDFSVEQKPVILADGQAVTLTNTVSGTASGIKSSNSKDDTIVENICKRCQLPIVEKYMYKVCEGIHHEDCVRCSICVIPLFDKCYVKGGHLYCRLHYYKEYSPYRCAGCRQGIAPTEMVYKIKADIIYHVSCHRCAQCGRKLSKGEQIYIDEATKTLACMAHSECSTDLFGISIPTTSAVCLIGTEDGSIIPNTISREIDSPSLFPYSYDTYGYEYGDESKFLKRRGPRTTIKQYQLDVLNRMFTATPKPSKHARAKLALETGLSMRVIQVWFQNRRSKERRLKHLCNYLRRFEQRGLIAPPRGWQIKAAMINNASSDGPPSVDRKGADQWFTLKQLLVSNQTSSSDSITLEQLLAFPFEADDEGEMTN